ncbi:MAG: SEC-C metal-binding domain-containing protein [Acidimicrobiia bacterium]|nr:SEC-C metal-binding domain-containing protein [Acidimicrobiia bacterium]
MDLDRGTLARIDRKLLAGLGDDETFQMVRVPVTTAKWSTWKRYCDSAGISMGRAIATLIDGELATVFGDFSAEPTSVFARQAEEELVRREEVVAAQERDLRATERRLRSRSEDLRRWEAEVEAREQRVELASKLAAQRRHSAPKIGRNERCPCGSGLKHKHCHGLPGRKPNALPR